MGEKPQNIKHRHISLGVLAHVDAGKTTLSEGLLFKCGRIRKIGRVDHKDAYLDTYELERERGITIFSKQARLETPHRAITLVDTPGHVDFAAEAELRQIYLKARYNGTATAEDAARAAELVRKICS